MFHIGGHWAAYFLLLPLTLVAVLFQIPVVYSFLGYSGMFICAAVVGVVGCVAVAFLPKHLDSEKYRTKFS